MSETDHFLADFNKTEPIMSIPEIYKITKGDVKDMDLKGYQAPMTHLYTPRSFKIPTDKRKDTFYEISKHAKDPDPTSYSPKYEQLQKRYWERPGGKFLRSKRETVTEEAGKISSRIPGPGDYKLIPKGSSQPLQKALLGKFDKDKDLCFLNDTEYLSELSPSSNHYFSKLEERDKAFGKMEKRLPVFKYYAKKPEKPVEKDVTGPGYLKELEESFHKKSLSTATPKYAFNKAKIVRKAEEIANVKKFVPGVGHYKDKEKAYTSYILEHKYRIPFISKSKDVRFTESYSKAKTWIPGPGSYELSPEVTKKK